MLVIQISIYACFGEIWIIRSFFYESFMANLLESTQHPLLKHHNCNSKCTVSRFWICFYIIFSDCPVIILSPSFQYAVYGKKVNFSGVIEAKLEFPTDARWQKVRNGNDVDNLDLEDEKYSGSSGLPPVFLLINEADFDDVGYYQLQVKISTGWCSSSTVQIQHVYGSKNKFTIKNKFFFKKFQIYIDMRSFIYRFFDIVWLFQQQYTSLKLFRRDFMLNHNATFIPKFFSTMLRVHN